MCGGHQLPISRDANLRVEEGSASTQQPTSVNHAPSCTARSPLLRACHCHFPIDHNNHINQNTSIIPRHAQPTAAGASPCCALPWRRCQFTQGCQNTPAFGRRDLCRAKPHTATLCINVCLDYYNTTAVRALTSHSNPPSPTFRHCRGVGQIRHSGSDILTATTPPIQALRRPCHRATSAICQHDETSPKSAPHAFTHHRNAHSVVRTSRT